MQAFSCIQQINFKRKITQLVSNFSIPFYSELTVVSLSLNFKFLSSEHVLAILGQDKVVVI